MTEEQKIKELEKRGSGYEFHDMKMLMTAMCHRLLMRMSTVRDRSMTMNDWNFSVMPCWRYRADDFLFHQVSGYAGKKGKL